MAPSVDVKDLSARFAARFGVAPLCVARAPGRLEILGNHTDYNEGYVLSMATNLATYFAIAPGGDGDGSCVVCDFSHGLGEARFRTDPLEGPRKGDWGNYIKGVLSELAKRGARVGAFRGALMSDVPLSAGMSSSAALEMAVCLGLARAFGIDLPKPELARVGQGVENNYMGLKSGLLDQFSSLYGEKDSLILCDFRDVRVLRAVPLPPGHSFVVANSMVKHNLVESDYNLRRESCERAVAAIRSSRPAVRALRDVDMDTLLASQSAMSQVDFRRALHVVGENDRVMAGVRALDAGDTARFGLLLRESHRSSVENFENSCAELDCLVELSGSLPGCKGARLSGGGFGGITIHLVEEGQAEDYRSRLATAYRLRTGAETATLACSAGAGAALVAM